MYEAAFANELVMKRRTCGGSRNRPSSGGARGDRAARAADAIGGFSQGQRVVIVTDPELRRRVAETCGESGYDEAGFGRWISECAAQFIPCVSEQIYHRRYQEPDKLDEDGEEIEWPTPYWWVDIGKTAMVLMLAAHNAGLAAGFAGPQDVPALKAMLGLPREFHPVGVIPVGIRCRTSARRRSSAAGCRSRTSPTGSAGRQQRAGPGGAGARRVVRG